MEADRVQGPATPAGSNTSMASPGGGGDDDNPRRKRAALAAQACETCRSRKTRCDEQRPKCSLCTRLDVECVYREPLPTKKDRSLQQIQEQLNRIENTLNLTHSAISGVVNPILPSISKGDLGAIITPPVSSIELSTDPTSTTSRGASITPLAWFDRLGTGSSRRPGTGIEMASGVGALAGTLAVLPNDMTTTSQNMAASQSPVTWPSIYAYLRSTGIGPERVPEPQEIIKRGTTYFLKLDMDKHDSPLSAVPFVPATPIPGQTMSGAGRVAFPELTDGHLQRLSDNYFGTFNVLYPILDREEFNRGPLFRARRHGYTYGDFDTVIVLLVLALGELGEMSLNGQPIGAAEGQPSGIRGGTVEQPPGLHLFNEARRRFGFLDVRCSIEAAQAWILSACYYESCSRHLDFQQSTSSAAMALVLLLRCEPHPDWGSPEGRRLSQVYWTCNMMENWFHVDLDLPRTDLGNFEDNVPLPAAEGPENDPYAQVAQMQFSALITLRRLISRIHVTIFESGESNAESQRDFACPPRHIITEMIRQLDSWRELLPPMLQWSDNARFNLAPPFDEVDRIKVGPLFTVKPIDDDRYREHKSVLATGTAMLRSRYYYARYLTLRPFVYKALHFPRQTQPDEMHCVAMCLQSCLLWPMSMYPVTQRKRLIPMLFTWNQNFMSILLILRMTAVDPGLAEIRRNNIHQPELESTVLLLLDWFRDMRLIDGVANWAWGILEHIYADMPRR